MAQIDEIFKAIESDDVEYIKGRVEMFGKQPNDINLKNQFNRRNNDGETPLHLAIIHRNIEMCELLIEGGADVNVTDGDGGTPLHYATKRGHTVQLPTAIIQVLIAVDTEIVKLLINAGADVNKEDDGYTALHFATDMGHTEIVKLLINAGADVNIKDGPAYGRTPLHYATYKGYTEIVQLLIDAGVNVNIKDGHGRTPLHMASNMEHKEIVKLLIEAGADPYIPDQDGKKPIDNPMIREIYEDYEILKSKQRLSLAKTLTTIDPEDSTYILPPEILEQIATAKRPGPSSEVRDRYKKGIGRVGGSKRRTKKIRKSKRKKRSKKKHSKRK